MGPSWFIVAAVCACVAFTACSPREELVTGSADGDPKAQSALITALNRWSAQDDIAAEWDMEWSRGSADYLGTYTWASRDDEWSITTTLDSGASRTVLQLRAGLYACYSDWSMLTSLTLTGEGCLKVSGPDGDELIDSLFRNSIYDIVSDRDTEVREVSSRTVGGHTGRCFDVSRPRTEVELCLEWKTGIPLLERGMVDGKDVDYEMTGIREARESDFALPYDVFPGDFHDYERD